VYGLQEERRGDEVEMLMVLLECLWVLHAGSSFNPRKGFESMLGKDWEIEEDRLGIRRDHWRRFAFAHRRTVGMIHDFLDGFVDMDSWLASLL
jgi:hypothetical protein